jgi:hypothetical protein
MSTSKVGKQVVEVIYNAPTFARVGKQVVEVIYKPLPAKQRKIQTALFYKEH